MKKIFLIVLIISSMLKADNFFSVGLGKTEVEYTDKRGIGYGDFISKDTTSLILEYGDDDKKNYRKYIASDLSGDFQSVSVMAEWAPRFDFFPSWVKSVVGLPSFSAGIGLGYNNYKLIDKKVQFLSYNLNYNLMFEIDNYCLKVGYKSVDDLENKEKDIDSLNSDTTYIVLEYLY